MSDHHYHRDRDDSRSSSRDREKRDSFKKGNSKGGKKNPLKLHVGNLPLTTSEDEVRYRFEKFGKVDDIKIIRKNANGQPLREFLYGFIVMSNEDEGREAMAQLNHHNDYGWTVSFSKDKGREEPRRSPERSSRKSGRSDEDSGYSKRGDNTPVSSSMETEKKKEPRDESPEQSVTLKESGSSSALLNLVNHSQNPNEIDKKTLATNLMLLLQLPPEKLLQLTSSMEKNILNGSSILVRELWLGNLPENLNEKKLRNVVEMFGDVENIEYYQKQNGSFGFVKFKKVSQASKANEGAAALRQLLESQNLKIAFSDHQRRKNVVADHHECDDDEELTSIIYIGYSSGSTVVPEAIIKETFSRYGEVLNINIKQTPKDNSAKSYVLVEMASLEEAKLARKRIFLMDDKREKRGRLGDKNCELCILVKPKGKETTTTQNPTTQQANPNIQNQSSLVQNFKLPGQPGFNPNMPFPNSFDPNFNPQLVGMNPNNPMFKAVPGMNPNFKPGMNMPMRPGMNMPPQQGNPNQPGFGGPKPNPLIAQKKDEKKGLSIEFLDSFQNIIKNAATEETEEKKVEETPEPEPKHEESAHNPIWSGFITKGKKNRVGADAHLVQGDEGLLKDYFNLDVSHRVTYDEVSKRPHIAIVTFSPSNATFLALFAEYLKYFNEKQRAGVIQLKKMTLYLVPPCEETYKIHPFKPTEFLGVFVDLNENSQREQLKEPQKADSPDNANLENVMSMLDSSNFEKILNQ